MRAGFDNKKELWKVINACEVNSGSEVTHTMSIEYLVVGIECTSTIYSFAISEG